jgi:hypothetical protein
MMLPRFTRRRVVSLLVAIPLVPAALWSLVLMIAPTDWARARLVRELEAVTGRKVAIGSIHLGPLGNLRINDVSVAEPATPGDPWLTVGEARLDVHLVQLLTSCCKAKEIAVDRLDLRIHRRGDGTLEFAGLLDGRPKNRTSHGSHSHNDEGAGPDRSHEVTLTLTGSRVVVLDDPSETQIELTEAEGRATWDGVLAKVEGLKGRLNGGMVEFAGTYDRSSKAPEFFAEMRAQRVALGVGMKSLGLLVPIVSDATDSVVGKVDLALSLRGRGDSLEAIRPGLRGFGAILLDPIDLSHVKILETLDGMHQIPPSSRVGSVESHFAIESERIATDDLTLKVAHVPISLAGWTDFSGRIDYRVNPDAVREKLAGKLPGDVRQVLGEIQDSVGDIASLRVTGTVDAPRLVTGVEAAGGRVRSRDEEKARLRDAAKKLRDKYLR